MTAIASTDVTYTADIRGGMEVGDKLRRVDYALAFGDSALTYPSGGIPLSFAKFGFRNLLVDLVISDPGNANGFVYKFDRTNKTIRIYQTAGTAAHTHNMVFKDAVVADASGNRVNVSGNKLGANTGADVVVSGAGLSGGISNSALGTAAALVELTTAAAPAAMTLQVMAYGK